MAFTQDQLKVINNRTGNMVVSAGAGSGKTTVMTKRITRSVIDGSDINRFLIVTFTKAAAADVREKLYKALLDAQRKNPFDKHISRQLMSLPGADISTVHAFCFSRIKQYFDILGLSPKVRAADETEAKRLMDIAVEKLMQSAYEKGESDFLMLADAFSGTKSDKAFCETVKEMYKALKVYPHTWDFYDEMLALLRRDGECEDFDKTETAKTIINDVYENVKADRENLLSLIGFAEGKGYVKCAGGLLSILDTFDGVLQSASLGYTTLRGALERIKNPAVSKDGTDAQDYEYIKEAKKQITDSVKNNLKYFMYSPEQCLDDIQTNIRLLEAMKSLLKEFENIYTEEKKKNDCIDFSDQEHLMLSLLENEGQPTRLCLDLRDSFDYIYIDEYQDTNPLQDRIFSLLSKDNRFMVGDVKQSIYRFRSAHPHIFKGYCKEYEDGQKGQRVVLRENFRCDKGIIDFCNRIFSFSPEIKECLNYGEEALIYNKQENTGDTKAKFIRIQCSEDKENQIKYTAQQMQTAEATYIASEINSLIGQPKNDGTPVCYGDIAILFSNLKSNMTVFGKVFEKAGIPFRTEKSENFLTREEILLAISALKTADNPTDDIALASVMRSPIFEFTADQMYKIRLCSAADSLYECVLEASKGKARDKNKRYKVFPSALNATPSGRRVTKRISLTDTALAEKCAALISRLAFWRMSAEGVPAHRFIWQLYNDTGMTSQVLWEKGGQKRYRNLCLLYEYARQYEQSGYKGLSEFLKYLEKTEVLDEASPPDDGGNTVKLMTIHRSKGLEFPVVFLADTDRQFKKPSCDRFMVRADGIGVRFAQFDGMLKRRNCVTDSLEIKELADDRAEETRKLYVALTRSRERLYVTCKGTDVYSLGGDLRTGNCHADWINTAFTEDTSFAESRVIEIADVRLSGHTEVSDEYTLPPEGLAERLSFVYPYGSGGVPAKISVSEIRPGLLEEEEYTRAVKHTSVLRAPSVVRKHIATAADKGTANHLFMQFADLASAKSEGCQKQAELLYQRGFVTKEQFEMMNFSLLEKFFDSSLYERIQNSKKVYREKRFSLLMSEKVLGQGGEESILVQGVIDCFFKDTDGSYTVIDYKTDRERDKQTLMLRHKPQLEFYKRAVEMMTGERVGKTVIYSFLLGEIEVK